MHITILLEGRRGLCCEATRVVLSVGCDAHL